jgi:cyclic beta-1,2-glucan synthetase
VAFAHASERSARPREIAVVPRPQRLAGASPRRCAAKRSRATSAPGSIPAPRCRSRSRCARRDSRVVFLLGQGKDAEQARALVRRHGGWPPPRPRSTPCAALGTSLDAVRSARPTTRSTADEPLAPYQDVSCRLWARRPTTSRRGLRVPRPAPGRHGPLARRPDSSGSTLLRAPPAVLEGDVQHWWHEPSGRGTRTRCSDDLLWLPHAAAHYVRTTGDARVLDEPVPFLEAPLLARTRRTPTAAARLAAAGRSSSIACAPSTRADGGAHGLPSSAAATGTTA